MKKLSLVMVAVVAIIFVSNNFAYAGHHGHHGHHGYYYNDGWALAGGLVGGMMLGAAIANNNYYNQPQPIYVYQPAPVYPVTPVVYDTYTSSFGRTTVYQHEVIRTW